MKQFFTYEQQIQKLKESDGLIIDDEEQTRNYLKLEGYYNIINGYSPIFKIGRKYYKGTKFENIKDLYVFDKNLRSIVYKYTTSIECHIKALIAHEFSRNHGVYENEYLTPNSFTKNKKSQEAISRLIDECNKTINDAKNSNSNKYREYIAHNFNKYRHIPMWVLIRALSFGTVSIFYKNMIEDERTEIANNYNITSTQLANMLEVVVSFRNIVAHGERTFCARLPKTRLSTNLSIVRKMCLPKNDKNENKFGRNDFLALLICCKYLLPTNEFADFMFELNACFDILEKQQNSSMIGKIKIEMGLKGNSWTLLPKLRI